MKTMASEIHRTILFSRQDISRIDDIIEGMAIMAAKYHLQIVMYKRNSNKLTSIMIERVEDEVDLLERHLQVLKMVIQNEPIGIVKMSNETGHAHHKVRYSLRILEEENLVEPSSKGAITTEHAEEFVDELNGKLDESIDKLETMKIDGVGEVRD